MAPTVRILAEPRVSHDVGVDAARVHVDGSDTAAAEFLAQRVGETADRELRCAVGTRVRHAEQPEDARRVDDCTGILGDQEREECPGAVDHAVEVDVPQPFVVLHHGVEHAGRHRHACVVEHRAKGCGRPVPNFFGEVVRACASRTSSGLVNVGPLMLASVSLRPRSSTSAIATGQPWAESRCARARPMPDAAPVMTTVWPLMTCAATCSL